MEKYKIDEDLYIEYKQRKNKHSKIKKILLLHIGIILLSIGVYFFKIPNGFSTGGVSGIATILSKITELTAAQLITLLNGLLLVVGFMFLRKATGILTVYCSLLFSGLTWIFEFIFSITSPITNETFLEFVYAMLFTSIGSALIFYCDASSGGTDIIALIIKKYSKINPGKALLISDFFIATSAFVVFDVKTGLFSLLGLFAKAFIVDGFIENLNACKYFVVITSKRKEISEFIIKNLHHGATITPATGQFTGEEKTMIHTVCKRIEAIKLRSKIKEIDPHAFIIITTSSEIIGRGFRNV